MKSWRPFLVMAILSGCGKPDARPAEARQELAAFAKSVRDYRDQKGRWPPNLIEAVGETCLGENHNCVGGQKKRLDPWGTPYEYDQSLRSVLLRSPGADHKYGTRDDLEVTVPAEGPLQP